MCQAGDEELPETGPSPGHHLLIVRGRKPEVLIRQPYRDLPGERLDDVHRPTPLEQLSDDLGGMARDDVLNLRQVLPPHHKTHDRDIVIIARRDVLAQNEWPNHAHHPRQVRAHGEDLLTVQDFLHIPELSYQCRHWDLEDRPVIAQLREERKRIASNLLHDELKLLAGYLLWVTPFGRDRFERIQDWTGQIPCACVVRAGYIRRIVGCRHGTTSLVRAHEDTPSRHAGELVNVRQCGIQINLTQPETSVYYPDADNSELSAAVLRIAYSRKLFRIQNHTCAARKYLSFPKIPSDLGVASPGRNIA